MQKFAFEEELRNLKNQFRKEIMEDAQNKSISMQNLFISETEHMQNQFSNQRYGKVSISAVKINNTY